MAASGFRDSGCDILAACITKKDILPNLHPPYDEAFAGICAQVAGFRCVRIANFQLVAAACFICVRINIQQRFHSAEHIVLPLVAFGFIPAPPLFDFRPWSAVARRSVRCTFTLWNCRAFSSLHRMQQARIAWRWHLRHTSRAVANPLLPACCAAGNMWGKAYSSSVIHVAVRWGVHKGTVILMVPLNRSTRMRSAALFAMRSHSLCEFDWKRGVLAKPHQKSIFGECARDVRADSRHAPTMNSGAPEA